MDPKELYPDYDNNNDPYHTAGDGGETGSSYGYRKPGAAITSMVLGICSVSLWFYPYIMSIPSLIMGIVAVVLANREQGRTDPKYQGFLKAGRITGIIGIIVSVLWTIIFTFIIGAAINGTVRPIRRY